MARQKEALSGPFTTALLLLHLGRCVGLASAAPCRRSHAALRTAGCRAAAASHGASLDEACLAAGCAVDGMPENDAMRRRLAEEFGSLRGFGSVRSLPLARSALTDAELHAQTGLPPAAFGPRSASTHRKEASLGTAGGVVTVQLVITLAALSREVPLKSLRELEWWQLPSIVLAVTAGTTLLLALADRLALNSQGIRAASQLLVPARREAILRHEAGHFLLAYLLGCPVLACVLSPWQSIAKLARGEGAAGTVYVSAAIEALSNGDSATDADVDAACVILMGGIAAEAITSGEAEGGAADTAALCELLGAHTSPAQPSRRELRERARWAVACAALLIREHSAAYDALCDALRRGASVGTCCMVIQRALGGPGARISDPPGADLRAA